MPLDATLALASARCGLSWRSPRVWVIASAGRRNERRHIAPGARRPLQVEVEGPPRQQGVLGIGDIGAVVGRAVHIQVSVSHARAPGIVEKGYGYIMSWAAPLALHQEEAR